ncbi:putative methyltransferase-domain-containing protein [Gongronella butleri]|nr:putative methyltransferase-domain-containing protein [Gongronella butleri]
MPKKKQPITRQVHDKSTFKQSRADTAKLIRRYHVLNKELSKCRNESPVDRAREQAILKEMDDIGGLNLYQKASLLGQSAQRGGDTSKWLLKSLGKLDVPKTRWRILEVGALSPANYASHAWITTYPIDLNPQHPDIKKQDFLTMPIPATEDEKFDIVSLSLVVNFVGDPKDRGKMLMHTRDFFYAIQDTDKLHYLFLVLPLPCITNSRYMTDDHLRAMMTDMGYTLCDHHFSNKLAHYLFELKGKPKVKHGAWKKQELRPGGKRNNFSIVI